MWELAIIYYILLLLLDILQNPSQLSFLASLSPFGNLAPSFCPASPFLSLGLPLGCWVGEDKYFLPPCLYKPFESLKISMSAPYQLSNLMHFMKEIRCWAVGVTRLPSLWNWGPASGLPGNSTGTKSPRSSGHLVNLTCGKWGWRIRGCHKRKKEGPGPSGNLGLYTNPGLGSGSPTWNVLLTPSVPGTKGRWTILRTL